MDSMTTDKGREEAIRLLRETFMRNPMAIGAIDSVIEHDSRIRQDSIAEAQAEIDLTYKMWCGRNYMHLPLHEAVGEVIKATEAEARREAAEIAVDWIHQEFSTQDDPDRQKAIDDALRGAIIAARVSARAMPDHAVKVLQPAGCDGSACFACANPCGRYFESLR